MITVITGELREGDVGLFAHYVHLREIPASPLPAIVLLFFANKMDIKLHFASLWPGQKVKVPK